VVTAAYEDCPAGRAHIRSPVEPEQGHRPQERRGLGAVHVESGAAEQAGELEHLGGQDTAVGRV
jgi:hypothetical protein